MLLAIDTATRKIGLALYDGVQVVQEAVWQSPNRHTVELSAAIDNALQRAGLTPNDLTAIALAIGPGSYTGLRIGTAVAKGLALAQHLPLIGVSSFDILAAAQPVMPEHQLATVLEAGRTRLAVSWYSADEQSWQPKGQPNILTPDEFAKKIRTPTLICGELDEDLQKVLGRKRKNVKLASPANSLRRPAYLAELAWARLQAGETDDPATLAPQYLQTGENIPA